MSEELRTSQETFELSNMRNFSIIAHIDHGKSTLSDRIIQTCGGLTAREMSQQVLDSMELERERGITIKSQCVSLHYQSASGEKFLLNLIDTPGHVDFSYEVSRSLAACEGALLLVDSTQGVEAQTMANCTTALELGLDVFPILNKVDLPTSDPVKVSEEIESLMGLDASRALCCSAKTGEGIDQLLEHIVSSFPPPQGSRDSTLAALIIDSWFDNYLGVVSLICVKEGKVSVGDRILVMSTQKIYTVESLGIFTPKRKTKTTLMSGEVGWLCCAIKEIAGAPVGATLTSVPLSRAMPLPGFKKSHPQVYAGLYPIDTDEFGNFRKALEKLSLNDAALTYEPETSSALGTGFRCGFLGLLHMEIIQERLEREYNLALIATMPTVVYRIQKSSGESCLIESPSQFTQNTGSNEIEEPIAECHILTPQQTLGKVMQLCTEKRGKQIEMTYHGNQVSLVYWVPMNEVVVDLFDQLKSLTRGFASLEYHFKCFSAADIVKLDLLLNGERVDAFSLLVHRSQAQRRGREVVDYLQNVIPRHQFDVAIQVAIGNQIVARSTIKQFRKNVTGKCYGGDITRKRKLLEKQKEGKKKMKQIGNIEIPKSAFVAMLNLHKTPQAS